jgi:arylformamidase
VPPPNLSQFESDPAKMSPVFRDYTQAQLDAQYDQATLVPDLSGYLKFWTEQSAAARATLDCVQDVAYGRSKAEKLDIFRPGGGAGCPVHLHFHGGSWKLLDKSFAALGAVPVVQAGGLYVAVGFGLVPAVPLATQVRQARSAVAWAWRNIAKYGGDPARITVSGHSSGGHLVGCLISQGWQGRFRVPGDVVKGAVAACGLYDLVPVRLSARQDYLHLSDADVHALSPVRHIPKAGAPELALYWGAGDLDEFRRQSRDFAAAWSDAGHAVEANELSGHNHFDVSNAFADMNGPIAAAIAKQMNRGL